MTRRVAASYFVILSTLATSLIAVTTLVPMASSAAILYVGGAGPGNFTTIQAAVIAASPGDMIFVYNGTYNENLVINKTLSLVGQARNATIVNGGVDDAIRVVADWVNVSGFTLTTNGAESFAALRLYHVKRCRVSDNNFLDVGFNGVFLDFSQLNMVVDNNISSTPHGVSLLDSRENTISRNTVSIAVNGVFLWDSDSNLITDNRISQAVGAVDTGGIYLYHSNSTYVAGNNVTDSMNGVRLRSSSSSVITNNEFLRNDAGVSIYYDWDLTFGADNNTIEKNNISRNGLGVWIDAATGNTISHNTITSNSDAGIYDLSGIGNVFDGNTVTNNTDGIWLAGTMWDTVSGNIVMDNIDGILYTVSNGVDQNSFYHNSIINNTNQAFAVGVNSWDDSYPSGGNYWSDYTGADNYVGPGQDMPGSDGIGDTPYGIPGAGNTDRYPLMGPWNEPTAPDLTITPGSVTLHPDPPVMMGSSFFINATILNSARESSGATSVRFYDGVPPAAQIGQDQGLAALPAWDSATVYVVWTPKVGGHHDVCVVADPDNLVRENNETNNMACIAVEVNFAVWLRPGHQFISFPTAVTNESIESVLSSLAYCYDYVRSYNPLDAASPWKSYVPGRGYDSLLRLNNTMGFWINMTSACLFALVDPVPSSTTIILHQGWNMVGFPSFNTSCTVADLRASIGIPGVIVELFDGAAAPYLLRRADDSCVMRAGEGYWVYVPADSIWVLKG